MRLTAFFPEQPG